MTFYEVIKATHIVTAILSISGFMIRGVWMMRASEFLSNKWIKILPHINDTILLSAAIILIMLSGQYPGPTTWINAKVIALIAYVLLGAVALKRGNTMKIRVTAWVLAIIVFTYIFAVANSKTVMPWQV